MFTKLTTVPCTANKSDLEGADSKAVGLASRLPNPLHFRLVVVGAIEPSVPKGRPAVIPPLWRNVRGLIRHRRASSAISPYRKLRLPLPGACPICHHPPGGG